MFSVKKGKSLLVTLVLCISLLLVFSATAFAADDLKLSAGDVTGEVGEEVIVEIEAENALDHEGGQFDLSFDEDVVEPVEASRGELVPDISGNLFDYNLELDPGELRVMWVIAEGAEDDSGVIGTITFEVLAEDETNLTFSNIVLSPDEVEAADPVSGSVAYGESVDEKQQAIDAANEAIDDLPDVEDITLADKADVENARTLVNEAKDLGAEDDDFDDLDKLEDAEKKIDKLEAIKLADDAILELPHVDVLTLDDKPDVVAARDLVDQAKDDYGAADDDFEYLSTLEACENRIEELEGEVPTPPTGEVSYLLPAGLLVFLAGLLLFIKRSKAVREVRRTR